MKLEEKIIYYANEYYNGNELISDQEYDALVSELKRTNPESKILNKVIGSDLKGISKKYKLPHNMNTLSKIHTVNEFRKWFNNNDNDLFVSLKVDGNSQLLEYKDGIFVRSLSRGNGELGEDTTNNVSKVKGVIKKINNSFNGFIRGEVVLKNKIFNKFFKGDANPRNTAAGLIKRLDGNGCEKLNFVAYEVFDNNNEFDKTELDKFSFLKNNGFEVPLWWSGCYCEDIIEFRNNLNNYINEVDYNCDGLVIKQNVNNNEDREKHIPSNSVAFKPESQIEITTLRDIEWSLQGNVYSPVAILDPVELDGTIVSRATLHNLNVMDDLGIYIGCKVEIIKSGQIIPKILKVVE